MGNRQVWPWRTQWSRAKANRVLPREHTGRSKHALLTDNTRWLYIWTSSDDPYRNQIGYTLCSQRWRSSIQSAKTRPGADCGSDHELLIAKFRLTLKKIGKITSPFRYDLNQIPYAYTVEVTNRFKELDLIEWRAMDRGSWHCTGSGDHCTKSGFWNAKGKMAVWRGCINSWEEKRSWRQRRKERYTHLNAEFKRIARRDKKAFLSEQCKEIEENNRIGKTRDLFDSLWWMVNGVGFMISNGENFASDSHTQL